MCSRCDHMHRRCVCVCLMDGRLSAHMHEPNNLFVSLNLSLVLTRSSREFRKTRVTWATSSQEFFFTLISKTKSLAATDSHRIKYGNMECICLNIVLTPLLYPSPIPVGGFGEVPVEPHSRFVTVDRRSLCPYSGPQIFSFVPTASPSPGRSFA